MSSKEQAKTAPAGASEPRGALPAWEDLPDIDLYMDQVVSLMTRYLGPVAEDGGKALTASMVNNYVKTGLVPPPAKKRYAREHLAYLAIVCSLKAVLPLSGIRELLERELSGQSIEQFYGEFRMLDEAVTKEARKAHGKADAPVLRASLRARAERELAITELRLAQ